MKTSLLHLALASVYVYMYNAEFHKYAIYCTYEKKIGTYYYIYDNFDGNLITAFFFFNFTSFQNVQFTRNMLFICLSHENLIPNSKKFNSLGFFK